MFHIELAEHIRLWDEEEKIGNVFTASVSIRDEPWSPESTLASICLSKVTWIQVTLLRDVSKLV